MVTPGTSHLLYKGKGKADECIKLLRVQGKESGTMLNETYIKWICVKALFMLLDTCGFKAIRLRCLTSTSDSKQGFT